GRRAAAADDRAGPDVGAETAPSRRADSWSGAEARPADLRPHCPPARRGRRDRSPRRAERPQGARCLRSRVPNANGHNRSVRQPGRAPRRAPDRPGLPRGADVSFQEFVQQCINGLSLGSTYALLALGLAIVFSIMGLINFAQGELLTIGGYVMWVLLDHDVSWFVVIPLTLLASTLAAVAMERIAFRPLRGAS